MSNEGDVIRRAYAEASLAAREKGLSGAIAVKAVLSAAAKVSTRILGHDISVGDVERATRQA